jgi:hypothetical protein
MTYIVEALGFTGVGIHTLPPERPLVVAGADLQRRGATVDAQVIDRQPREISGRAEIRADLTLHE